MNKVISLVLTFFQGALCFLVGALVASPELGCLSKEAKEAAADSAYAAEHLRCVDKFDTKEQIDACRAAVRLRWGITETVRDAGGDR